MPRPIPTCATCGVLFSRARQRVRLAALSYGSESSGLGAIWGARSTIRAASYGIPIARCPKGSGFGGCGSRSRVRIALSTRQSWRCGEPALLPGGRSREADQRFVVSSDSTFGFVNTGKASGVAGYNSTVHRTALSHGYEEKAPERAQRSQDKGFQTGSPSRHPPTPAGLHERRLRSTGRVGVAAPPLVPCASEFHIQRHLRDFRLGRFRQSRSTCQGLQARGAQQRNARLEIGADGRTRALPVACGRHDHRSRA